MKEKALFLDRDGLICHIVEYINGFDGPQKVEDVKLIEGIENVIQLAKSKKWKVIEISNQPGVAKGKQTSQLAAAIEAKVHTLLKEANVSVDATYICQHAPHGVVKKLSIECDCRKPKPGLLLKAAYDYNIDLSASIFYGDKATDVQASIAAGCKSMILLHTEDVPEKVLEAQNAPADYKARNHKEAYAIISEL